MQEIFADTNYWVALFVPSDSLHFVAHIEAEALRPGARVVTSDLVIIEVLNSLSRQEFNFKALAVSTIDLLRESPDFLVVPCSRELLQRASELYLKFSDKEWSIVDCSS